MDNPNSQAISRFLKKVRLHHSWQVQEVTEKFFTILVGSKYEEKRIIQKIHYYILDNLIIFDHWGTNSRFQISLNEFFYVSKPYYEDFKKWLFTNLSTQSEKQIRQYRQILNFVTRVYEDYDNKLVKITGDEDNQDCITIAFSGRRNVLKLSFVEFADTIAFSFENTSVPFVYNYTKAFINPDLQKKQFYDFLTYEYAKLSTDHHGFEVIGFTTDEDGWLMITKFKHEQVPVVRHYIPVDKQFYPKLENFFDKIQERFGDYGDCDDRNTKNPILSYADCCKVRDLRVQFLAEDENPLVRSFGIVWKVIEAFELKIDQ
jgi:hypothetical protein